jgi:hypothetical protein
MAGNLEYDAGLSLSLPAVFGLTVIYKNVNVFNTKLTTPPSLSYAISIADDWLVYQTGIRDDGGVATLSQYTKVLR